ncbi:right-handed parallel beta-helix repeat-containing protein [Paraburkholderia sp. MMS20-SJTR3]|uniref:Right-handed parallel beta-helix repeat-containing protein n=1 Tax=Paraburkholderia sejongensis TaxID=2886946 RepID=A0ABS8K3T9_9BURK|nr:right-handed parallel beta-helix repeat-containing protein [Paraburkholderia sp. MMS20-SJTR3]MCC8396829.1 right-handed parallel beta-helix repeat-containing protein [Paraburkholderia sp. MMS20-SJTR3]
MKKLFRTASVTVGICLAACGGGGGSGGNSHPSTIDNPDGPSSENNPSSASTNAPTGASVSAGTPAPTSTPSSTGGSTIPDATVFPATGGSDQADSLQRAFDGLQTGQRLVFAPGQYVVTHSLAVKNPQVVISGYGATLIATTVNDQTIVMSGSNSTLAGLTLIGAGSTRLATPSSTKVEVTGTGVQVLDITIRGGASAGIFVFGGNDIAIVGNRVQDTLADGIHTTYGSRNVLVQGNTVSGTGDDMISVVSYQGDGALSSNILIAGNTLSGNYWGRGISVVGGSDVTITGNTVQGVQKAAGVLISQEDSWQTYNATNAVITNNLISDIQNSTSANNGRLPTQQAAIELDTGAGAVTFVSVTNNQVSRSAYAGFRALGNVCQLLVSGNVFASIAGTLTSLLSSGCPASQSVISSNMLDGKALLGPVGSSATGAPNVTGANTTFLPQIRNYLRQTVN